MARTKKKKVEEVVLSEKVEETQDSVAVPETPVEDVKTIEVPVIEQLPEQLEAYQSLAVKSEVHMLKIAFRNAINKHVKEQKITDNFKVLINPLDIQNIPSMFQFETSDQVQVGKFLIVK